MPDSSFGDFADTSTAGRWVGVSPLASETSVLGGSWIGCGGGPADVDAPRLRCDVSFGPGGVPPTSTMDHPFLFLSFLCFIVWTPGGG